jgi:hypothetical protein
VWAFRRRIGHGYERTDLANRSLDNPHLARPILTEALDLANRLANDFGLHVLLTGRRARSPTLQKALQNLVNQDFTIARLHDDKENHMYVSPKMGGKQSYISIR